MPITAVLMFFVHSGYYSKNTKNGKRPIQAVCLVANGNKIEKYKGQTFINGDW